MAAELRINELLNNFKYYFDEDDPEKIKELNEKITLYYTRNKLTETENYACHLYNLSLFYINRGDYAQAYEPCKNALSIVERLKKERLAAIFSGNLGIICMKLGKTDTGSMLLRKSYRLIFYGRESESCSYLDKADACINLGSCCYDLKDPSSAVRYHIRALEFRGEKDEEYANNLNLIGYDYEKLEEYDKAIGYFKNALDILKTLFTEEDTDYIANVSYLASVYRKSENYADALSEYDKTLYLLGKTGLLEEPFGGEVMNRAAEVSSKTGDDKKALDLRMRALDIFEKSLGVKNIFYANCLKEIADIYRRNFIYGKAISNLQRDLEIKSSLMSAEEKEYINDARLLSDVYSENGQADKAAEVLEYVLENISSKHKSYKELLLDTAGKYMDGHNTRKLYELYEKYRKTDPTATFDEMLVMAEKRKQK